MNFKFGVINKHKIRLVEDKLKLSKYTLTRFTALKKE